MDEEKLAVSPGEPHRGFRFTDPRQERIYRRLLRVGPGPAAFFRDACLLVSTPAYAESTSHLIAHLLRDIESAIRGVLVTIADRENRGGGSTSSEHAAEVKVILQSLQIPATDPVAMAWLKLTDRESGLARRAHRNELERPRPLDREFEGMWEEIQTIFDVVLDKLEATYLAFFPALDVLLAKQTPSQKDLKKLRGDIPSSFVLRRYFFDRLQHPEWLKPLRENGFFDHPPPVERDPVTGTISVWPWPESGYLARMAKRPEAQQDVLETCGLVPETDNVRVHEDIVQAACSIPPPMASNLVSRIMHWLPSPLDILLPEKFAELVTHLANGGEVESALALARTLLVRSPEKDRRRSGGLDEWVYAKVLGQCQGPLAHAGGEKAFILFSDVLQGSISPAWQSFIWIQSIELASLNDERDSQSMLVAAVRDTAVYLVTQNESCLRSLLSNIRERHFPLLDRLALCLLRLFPTAAPELTAQYATHRPYFDDIEFRNEYFPFLQASFRSLPELDQGTVLKWIEDGPDVTKFLAFRAQFEGEPPSAEQIDRYRKAWQRDRLAPINSGLPPEWSSRFGELVSDLGEPEPMEQISDREGMWVGPTSPRSSEDIAKMPAEELVVYLKEWKAPGDMFGPTPEGLGRAVTEVIREDPAKYALDALSFQALDPTYVRSLFAGLLEALQKGREFGWGPVLQLALWVTSQPRDIEDRSTRERDADPHWGWTRKTIANLLGEAMQRDLSVDLRNDVWAILETLAEDPDPTPEDEERYGGSNMDPHALSINTIRGEALHSVVRYALWIRRHQQKESDYQKVERGFEEMPEVRTVLEKHLESSHDSALAIRAVYGRWFPWLNLLDKRWAASYVGRIFPHAAEDLSSWRAAWNTYVTSCPPFNDIFSVLRDEYTRAIHLLGANNPDPIDPPDERLAEHLMLYYGRGILSLDERDGPLQLFFTTASDSLREHALAYIGRVLLSTSEKLGPEFLDRFMRLWEARLSLAVASRQGHEKEIGAFGLWFASGRLSPAWSFEQLQAAVKAGRIDNLSLVLDRVAVLAPNYPCPAMRFLVLLMDRPHEPWLVSASRREFRAVLTAALRSEDRIAAQDARTLINKLAADGHIEFRDLLSMSSGSPLYKDSGAAPPAEDPTN